MKVKTEVIFLGEIKPKNPAGRFVLKLFDIDGQTNLDFSFPGSLEAKQGEVLTFDGSVVMKIGKYGAYLIGEGVFHRNGASR